MPINIRLARPEDATALPEVERDAGRSFLAIRDLAWVASDTVTSAEDHLPLIAARTVWVAEEDSDIVGFLAAEVFGDALHIWEVAVERDYQQRGIGARLLTAAAQHARTARLVALTLTTFRDVPWNAPFYARNGFRLLDAASLDDRLAEALRLEIENGLPGEQRCAMRRPVVRL
jgi:GNAT superfamily N-acetyltransferase